MKKLTRLKYLIDGDNNQWIKKENNMGQN